MRRSTVVWGALALLGGMACSENSPTAVAPTRSLAVSRSVAPATPTLTVDQQNVSGFTFDLGINASGGIAQGFTPTANRLDAVDLFLTGSGSNPPLTLTVTIRAGAYNGPDLGSTTLAVPAGLSGTPSNPTVLQAVFATSVPLTPGNQYYIHVDPDGGFLGAAAAFGNAYTGGDAYQGDFTLSGLDIGFRTYFAQPQGPKSKDDCKNGGWATFTYPRTFKNQGDCIQFVNTGK